jgi:hypothetical protein
VSRTACESRRDDGCNNERTNNHRYKLLGSYARIEIMYLLEYAGRATYQRIFPRLPGQRQSSHGPSQPGPLDGPKRSARTDPAGFSHVQHAQGSRADRLFPNLFADAAIEAPGPPALSFSRQ